MPYERPFPEGSRIEDLDLSNVHLHGASFEGAKLTDASLGGADISGDIEGLRINDVEVEPLVRDELDRRHPERAMLRATDVAGLRGAWAMLETLWARTSVRAAGLPADVPHQRVEGEWSFVETLRHLVFATDCWLSRAIELEPHPYHPWGLPWTGAGTEWATRIGIDLGAAPSLAEVTAVRRQRQDAVRGALERLTDTELDAVRTAPDDDGHPSGAHSVRHCVHVILNEEWEHHRYATRDLDVLDPEGADRGATGRATRDARPAPSGRPDGGATG